MDKKSDSGDTSRRRVLVSDSERLNATPVPTYVNELNIISFDYMYLIRDGININNKLDYSIINDVIDKYNIVMNETNV